MQFNIVVKDTFICDASIAETSSAAEGLFRSSSCPSLAAVRTRSPEHVSSKDSSAVLPLTSRLGCWADILSDSEDEDASSSSHSVGLRSFDSFGETSSTVKVGEKTPARKVSVQASEKARAPLSSKASEFVPFSPLNSRAPAFVPRSAQTVSESQRFPVRGIPQQNLTKPTTVMLRNLPCRYTRDDLVSDLNLKGFAGLYDFVYMPMDFKRKLCMGYGFVNLTAGEQVQHFIEKFDGHRSHPSSTKVCEVSLSRTQGLATNIERFRNSSVMGDEVPEYFKPAIFLGERQVPFPEPSKEVSPVRPKRAR
jgi:hypothetical protein